MRATSTPVNMADDRQKEYQRQQERLKAMAGTADKVKTVSADMMIENLLKDSFKKPSLTPTQNERLDQSYPELPHWLQCESSGVPSQYKYLWSLVQLTADLADTQKVSQLLLTSGLHVDVLGFIWNLCNKIIPGQLTKQEFYIVLALVSLAQTGCTFNNLSVLKLIPGPSIPALQPGVIKSSLPPPCAPCSAEVFNPVQQFPNIPILQSGLKEEKPTQLITNSAVNEMVSHNDGGLDLKRGLDGQQDITDNNFLCGGSCSKSNEPHPMETIRGPYKTSNFPCIGSSPTAEFEDDFSDFQSVPVKKEETCKQTKNPGFDAVDDFTDFQSANIEHLDPFETVVITQKREIPKIPLPKSFSGKLTNLKTNILKISPESERKLKGLSQPESLSSLPESKISSNNKVSTSISLLGSNHGIGSRLANHSFSTKPERSKHHKHHKIKMSVNAPAQANGDEEIILGVKPTNIENLIPKCCPKNSATCKTFVLKETKIGNEDAGEGERAERGNGENTRQIEIPMLGTFNETVLPTQAKPQTPGVDLITVQEDKYSALREIDLEWNQEKSQTAEAAEGTDDFGDFLSADIPPPDPVPWQPPEVLIPAETNEKEGWGEWSFSAETNPGVNGVETETKVPAVRVEEELFDSFSLVALGETDASKPSTNSRNIFGKPESSADHLRDVFSVEAVPREKTNECRPLSKPDALVVTQSDNEFWEFLGSEVKPPTGGNFSRQGSLPSLDLKVSSTEESEQEMVSRRCLESCHNLIQEGFEIFNNITIKSILDEVFAAPKTSDYLNYLNIVYQISKRVSQNSDVSTTQEDLERLWGRLRELCFEYNIKLRRDEDSVSEGKSQCNICLKYVGEDLISHGTSSYHPSCANLWINFVDGSLPSYSS